MDLWAPSIHGLKMKQKHAVLPESNWRLSTQDSFGKMHRLTGLEPATPQTRSQSANRYTTLSHRREETNVTLSLRIDTFCACLENDFIPRSRAEVPSARTEKAHNTEVASLRRKNHAFYTCGYIR